ncbi:DUF3429 domain-containing protein [Devosia sp.]|uniref:DUF3429 domain-containing protein n=1 Tax=Devosia sp. TaxID=1871048 RepID=UPI003A8CA2EF
MTESQTRVALAFTYAGILPPWLALALHLTLQLPLAALAALLYGAIIASFVCGMHWGLFMQARQPVPINLLITSNVGALAAWVMALVSIWSLPLAFIGLAVLLGALLAIDRRLLSAKLIDPWFWALRRNASLGLGGGLALWSLCS